MFATLSRTLGFVFSNGAEIIPFPSRQNSLDIRRWRSDYAKVTRDIRRMKDIIKSHTTASDLPTLMRAQGRLQDHARFLMTLRFG